MEMEANWIWFRLHNANCTTVGSSSLSAQCSSVVSWSRFDWNDWWALSWWSEPVNQVGDCVITTAAISEATCAISRFVIRNEFDAMRFGWEFSSMKCDLIENELSVVVYEILAAAFLALERFYLLSNAKASFVEMQMRIVLLWSLICMEVVRWWRLSLCNNIFNGNVVGWLLSVVGPERLWWEASGNISLAIAWLKVVEKSLRWESRSRPKFCV